ncbi:MAG: response regulator [Saprospiraceae bacterium]
MKEIDVLKRRLERERLARKQAENILEKKALELYAANEELRKLNESLEQKIAQRTLELRISEDKYRGIIEDMELGLMEVDNDGIIVKAYQRFCDMLGYHSHELNGKNAIETLLPEEYLPVMERQAIERLEGRADVYEVEVFKKNGERIWVLISGSPIYNLEGEMIGTIGIHYDMTAQKNLEKELAKAKITAEQAQKAEQQFLANMSHEIRTPMNAVIGMTHLLYETNLSETQKEYIDALRFSADSLMGLINNILDLSKIEAGELEFEEQTFNLQQMLKGLQRTFQFKVKDKPVSVDMAIDERITNLIIGDPTRLNQILTNLLGNASKFTHQGTIGVKAILRKNSHAKFWIEFQVHDTGIGIPNDKLDIIFENFKQADIKVTRKYGGTGLGLTIVKELIEIQGGNINAQSKPNEGSVFKFILPYGDSGVIAVEKARSYEKSNAHLRKLLKDQYVLVVEDNDMNQKLITKILEIWECSFDLAVNGKEAVAYTMLQKYDLILMDIHMPEMDGVEATSTIRNDGENLNQHVPIIAMTAAALLDEKNRAIKAGMNDYLTKPFSPDLLLEKIGEIMGFRADKDLAKANEVPNITGDFPTISFNYLYEFSNGDRIFVKDMVDTFIKESPKTFEEMNKAFVKKDWEGIYKIAHRMKPNFMMLGMKTQQDTAAQIERMIKKEDYTVATLQQLIQDLESAAEQAYPILEEKLAEI